MNTLKKQVEKSTNTDDKNEEDLGNYIFINTAHVALDYDLFSNITSVI